MLRRLREPSSAGRAVGYDDVLAIENEDVDLTPEAAVEEAARFMRSVLSD